MNHGDQVAQTTNSTDEISTTAVETNGGSLFRADRRQKKVVYSSFSDSPYDVLEIRVEQHPPPPHNSKDVVVKVSVSRHKNVLDLHDDDLI